MRQVREREREDSHSKFTAGMGEVSESPSGNKSIRYLNSHYADVVSWNKESTSRRIVRGRERETEKEGSGTSAEKRRRALSEN